MYQSSLKAQHVPYITTICESALSEYTMNPGDDQQPPTSSWFQDSGSWFPESSFSLAQNIDGLLQPDIYDGIINTQPDFYLGQDYANLLSSTFAPDANEFVSPASSPSSHSDAASSPGPLDDGSRSVASVPSGTRKVVALAPAQPKSPQSGDVQPPRSTRHYKRREQNRAAQRAFRQRKEQHVKLLEDKVAALEANQERIDAENARLQQDLNKATAENAILRSWSDSNSPRDLDQSARASTCDDGHVCFSSPPPVALGFEPQSLTASTEAQGGDVLCGSKIWEFILRHHLFQEGLVDVKVVAQRLQSFRRRHNTDCITEAVLIGCIENSAQL